MLKPLGDPTDEFTAVSRFDLHRMETVGSVDLIIG